LKGFAMKRILIILTCCLVSATLPAAAYEVGDLVENITLPDLSGAEANLSDYAGKIIVLNFFASWCPSCNEEAEHLQHDIWEVYEDDGVVVIAIDVMEQVSLVQGWAAAVGATYPIWMAPDWSLILQFPQALGLPYNAILDRSFEIRYGSMGFDQTAITNMIQILIDEGPTPVYPSTLDGVKGLYR